jgi:hypothetical protein
MLVHTYIFTKDCHMTVSSYCCMFWILGLLTWQLMQRKEQQDPPG